MFLLVICIFCWFFDFCKFADPNWNIKNKDQLLSKEFWFNDAQRTLYDKITQETNKYVANNIIFFLGDGMSVPTVTASRIYEGQMRGIVGERNRLSFEQFPYVGLSKTYCVDKQVADSACSATAYLTGVKSNYLTIGVTPNVLLNDCEGSILPENHLSSIASWALDQDKAVGVVTTTRVTHASPAGNYAHTSNRDFESDYDVLLWDKDPTKCPDIAKQLIEDEVSSRFKVILGGGTRKFLPNTTSDYHGNLGERWDGRNLIEEWKLSKPQNAQVIYDRDQLLHVDTKHTDYLLGLFNATHLPYHLDDSLSTPTLEEMTEMAIKILSNNKDGFFLFVEGGRIDHAHHQTKAKKALDETVQFSNAIRRARQLTKSWDTLIVVTADHGHTMTLNGYPDLDNSITGLSTELGEDNLPYSTLSYANGPVYERFYKVNEDAVQRVNITTVKNFGTTNFRYPHGVPSSSETHGGSDVAVYASGPFSHIFSGVYEQNTLPHLMAFAACIGPGRTVCNPFPEFLYKSET